MPDDPTPASPHAPSRLASSRMLSPPASLPFHLAFPGCLSFDLPAPPVVACRPSFLPCSDGIGACTAAAAAAAALSTHCKRASGVDGVDEYREDATLWPGDSCWATAGSMRKAGGGGGAGDGGPCRAGLGGLFETGVPGVEESPSLRFGDGTCLTRPKYHLGFRGATRGRNGLSGKRISMSGMGRG